MKQGPLIQIVEDAGIQVMLTRLHLERAGCQMVAARDGKEALEQVKDQRPDVHPVVRGGALIGAPSRRLLPYRTGG